MRDPVHFAARARRPLAVLLCVVAWLVGCGGGDAPPSSGLPPAFESRTSTLTIGASGGTLQLGAADGTLYSLVVAPGALSSEQTISMTTVQPAGTSRAAVQFAPTGLRLAHEAVLSVTPPAGAPFAAHVLVAFDGTPMPAELQPSGALRVALPMLPGEAAASAQAAGAPTAANVQTAARGRERVLQGASPACGVVASGPNSGGVLDIEDPEAAVDISITHSCVLARVRDLERQGRYEQAIRLNLVTAAFMQRVGEPGVANAQALLDSARTEVCRRQQQALQFATVAPATSPSDVVRLSKLVLYWDKQAQLLGAVCSLNEHEVSDTLTTKASQVIAWVESRRSALATTNSSEHAEGLATGRELANALPEMRSLRPASPAIEDTIVRGQLEQRVESAITDAMIDGPWQSCRSTGDYGPLRALVNAFGGIARVGSRVGDAIHYCGATTGAQSRKADGSALANLAQPLGGVDARTVRKTGTIAVVKGGTLRLSGPIGKLQCAPGVQSQESLAVYVNGVEVGRDAVTPYLTGGLELGIDRLITDAGADPSTVRTLTLTLRRLGDACAGFWGAHPAPLLTLELSFGQQAQAAKGSGTASYSNGCGTQTTIPFSIDATISASGVGGVSGSSEVPYSGGTGTFSGDFATGASIVIAYQPFDGASTTTSVTVTAASISGSMRFDNTTTVCDEDPRNGPYFAQILFSVPRQ